MSFSLQMLKNPPEGMEAFGQSTSWRWFKLMDEAMNGHLAGTATIVHPSLLDEDEECSTALPTLILPNTGDFSDPNPNETGSMDSVGALGEVLELSESDSLAEIVADGGDMMETNPVLNKNQTATFSPTVLPEFSDETLSASSNNFMKAAEVDRKLVELQREKQALEREQTEFDRELISLERDRELLNKDVAYLKQNRTILDRDRAAVERDRAVVERERALLDRDRALLDRDRAFLERDRVFLERAREDLEKERALMRKERAALDGNQAEMSTEKEVLLHTKFCQSLVDADLDPEKLETRQRLVSLFQKLVEKL